MDILSGVSGFAVDSSASRRDFNFKKKKLKFDSERHEQKFRRLLREHSILTGIENNPNNIINNLTRENLTAEEEHVLRFGIKHGLATRPKESDIIASAESIWEQLKRKNLLPDSFIKQQKVKNSIKAMACNFLDFDNRRLTADSKHIKILKDLRQRFVILKPDKGNGIVLLKLTDYVDSISAMFADTTKFKLVNDLNSDICLTQLNTLQQYLRTIHNRGEIDDTTYKDIRPQSTRPARAHGLPKTHKHFDHLPSFRPIIDTTGTAYEFVAKYLSKLLYPLTFNEHKLKDSFDAVNRIHNISPTLFSEGYRFVSFDVTSLFTNIPLHKTVNIILN
jgi:hypothetical protein